MAFPAQHRPMKKLAFAAASLILFAASSPAWAQFPPPGVYLCVDMNGAPFGTLALQVAGDYQFASPTELGGSGQLASSGNSVDAISGPLADLHLSGSFSTNESGVASFMFTSDAGSMLCAPPAP
jgi:hypothetical protein